MAIAMSRPIVALAVAFALGAALVLDAYQRHPVACKESAVQDGGSQPVDARTERGLVPSWGTLARQSSAVPGTAAPIRESLALSHPLACEQWVRSCADFSPCVEACR